jgi:glycosyltransferase involved in cell wall biosynthesis
MKTLVPGAATKTIRDGATAARYRPLAGIPACYGLVVSDPTWRLSAAKWVGRARLAARLRPRPTPVEPASSPRWKARLDEPANGGVVTRGLNVIGGWAIHDWRRIQGVVVSVNGRPHTFATEFYERADVANRWSDFATVGSAGWSAMLDLGSYEGDEVVVSAHALMEPRRRGRPPGRVGPVLHIGTARCRVDGAAPPTGLPTGHFHQEPFVLSGYARVTGVIQSADDVATVEVELDGRSVGLARTTPVPTAVARGSGTILTTRFASVVEIPDDSASVSLSATLTSMSGKTHQLGAWHPEVRAPARPARPDADRLDVVRRRGQARLEAQQSARQAADRADEPTVLVVTHDLALGGGQLYLHELLLRLLRRGVRFALVSPRSGVLTDELEALGVPVLITGETQPRDPEAYEAQVLTIASWAVQHGCRSALANTMTAFTGVDAALRLELPVTWAIHESYPFGQFWMEAFGPGVAHDYIVGRAADSLGRASRVVFEAHETLRLYEPLLAPGAGVVVPYGVDLSEIERYREEVDRDDLRATLGIGPDTLALLCMGTVEPRKCQVNLARAFAGSPRVRGSDCELIFVGASPGEHHTEELRHLVADLGDVRIRIEPVQREIHRWYHACDVLVSASDVESLPRSMLEAMAFGRPVASAAVFGIPELVEDGVSGFLCRSRDLGALREMLERVAGTSAHDLIAMGARARGVVTTRHDPRVYEGYYLEELTRADLG